MNDIRARRSEQLEQASQRAGELMHAMLEEDQPEWLSKHCQAYHRLTDGLPIHFLACVSDYLDGLLQTTLLDWAADAVPLAGAGFGWVLPALAGLGIGLLLRALRRRRMPRG